MRFFDHNATTPLLPEAKTAWVEASETHWLNPSSPYRAGAAVHARLKEARERLASLLEISAERVVFNSGATEGNNAVFAYWAGALDGSRKVGVGATEHPSVLEAAKHFLGARVECLQPDAAGVIGPGAADLGQLCGLSVMAANNETGILNPWQEWAELCRERGIPFHCDASQWIGKMPLSALAACDFLTACAHKFGGPKGVGFLLVPEGFRAGLVGGEQESGRRAGTENVAGILSMLAALESVESRRQSCSAENKERFIQALKKSIPGAEVVGETSPALWNTASVILPDFKSARWIRALERKGFLVSAGSACSTGKQGPSHVLAAMAIDGGRASRSLRISASLETSTEDWQALHDALLECHKELKEEASEANSRVISI